MLKQLKSFFTKIRATIPLTEVPLARPKSLTKEGGVLFFDRRKNVSTQKLKLFSPEPSTYPPGVLAAWNTLTRTINLSIYTIKAEIIEIIFHQD